MRARSHWASWVLVGALAGCGPAMEPVVAPTAGAPGAPKGPPTPADELGADGIATLGRTSGITIYRRPREVGVEFAAEADLPGSPERVRRVLLDYPAHTKWQDHVVASKVLEQGSDWVDVYERLGLPVIEDRDYTLHVTWGEDAGGVLWTKFVAKPELGPAPVEGVTRVRSHTGAWRLLPTGGGQATHAVYRFYLDLDSDLQSLMGAGQAESGIVEYFHEIANQLPNYP
jgi:hypothetical protein